MQLLQVNYIILIIYLVTVVMRLRKLQRISIYLYCVDSIFEVSLFIYF